METNEEIMKQLQPIVLAVVGDIFNRKESEFYEEALSLVYDLTSKSISPEMWHVLELMYKVNIVLQNIYLNGCFCRWKFLTSVHAYKPHGVSKLNRKT